MKTILVPTDFSSNAETALHFAILLAKKLKAKIVLAHVYQTTTAFEAAPHNMLADEVNEPEGQAERGLKALCMHIQHAQGIDYEYFLEKGPVLDVLERIIEEREINLVVMGTRGNKKLSSSVFGSTTSHLMAATKCPVLALPEGVRFNSTIKRMTYATDYRVNDIQDIGKLVDIAKAFAAQINVMHISDVKISAEEEVKMMSDFMKKVNERVNYNNLSFQILHGSNVEKKLEEYIKKESTDLLVMTTHHRSLLDFIFGKSMTADLVLETPVPLLAFHYSKTNSKKMF